MVTHDRHDRLTHTQTNRETEQTKWRDTEREKERERSTLSQMAGSSVDVRFSARAATDADELTRPWSRDSVSDWVRVRVKVRIRVRREGWYPDKRHRTSSAAAVAPLFRIVHHASAWLAGTGLWLVLALLLPSFVCYLVLCFVLAGSQVRGLGLGVRQAQRQPSQTGRQT